MGAKGIKRRKPYRRLPPVDLPTENDLIPPHIMWPGKGSGFEADPFSPAGQAQRSWWALNAVRRRGPVANVLTMCVAWLFLAYLAYVVLGVFVRTVF